jgi:hypothetical protein
VGDVIRSKTAAARPKDLDALPGLLRIARGRAGHHETRGGRSTRDDDADVSPLQVTPEYWSQQDASRLLNL